MSDNPTVFGDTFPQSPAPLGADAGDGAARRRVAVFGAGIAGLTAAHELVARGYQVTVFEQDDHVGGIAKSQFGVRRGPPDADTIEQIEPYVSPPETLLQSTANLDRSRALVFGLGATVYDMHQRRVLARLGYGVEMYTAGNFPVYGSGYAVLATSYGTLQCWALLPERGVLKTKLYEAALPPRFADGTARMLRLAVPDVKAAGEPLPQSEWPDSVTIQIAWLEAALTGKPGAQDWEISNKLATIELSPPVAQADASAPTRASAAVAPSNRPAYLTATNPTGSAFAWCDPRHPKLLHVIEPGTALAAWTIDVSDAFGESQLTAVSLYDPRPSDATHEAVDGLVVGFGFATGAVAIAFYGRQLPKQDQRDCIKRVKAARPSEQALLPTDVAPRVTSIAVHQDPGATLSAGTFKVAAGYESGELVLFTAETFDDTTKASKFASVQGGVTRINSGDLLAPVLWSYADMRVWTFHTDCNTYATVVNAVEFTGAPEILPVQPDGRFPLPGEHGFRFFPAFYRHLTDTMRRTPLIDRPDKTAADNLMTTVRQGVARMKGAPGLYEFPRDRPSSLEAVSRAAHRMLSGLGYDEADIARFQVKVLQFVTSCHQRREQYANMSWWDFVEGDRYSPVFRNALDAVPQALVALNARRADARTQGAVMVQLLLDQATTGAQTDRTLNGPTNRAWLDHWARHLRDSGVIIQKNSNLQSLVAGNSQFVKAQDGAPALKILGYQLLNEPAKIGDFEWYVLALPVVEVQRLLRDLRTVDSAGNLQRLDWTPSGDLKKVMQFPFQSSSAWMAGLQFFLPTDVSFLRGHIFFPDTPWGLSSISQAQFWAENLNVSYQVRGILSVVVGQWDARVPFPAPGDPDQNWWDRSEVPGLTAKQCSKEQLSREVWRQINAAVNAKPWALDAELRTRTEQLPMPLYVHVDQTLQFQAGQPIRVADTCKYLLNTVGDWDKRPGALRRNGYRLDMTNLAMCGNHMKTFTRLSTMESANESARHAVNAILRAADSTFQGELATIFPMERSEPGDAASLIRLDEILCASGLPHLVEILGLVDLVDRALPLAPGRTMDDVLRSWHVPPVVREWLSSDWLQKDPHTADDMDNDDDPDFVGPAGGSGGPTKSATLPADHITPIFSGLRNALTAL